MFCYSFRVAVKKEKEPKEPKAPKAPKEPKVKKEPKAKKEKGDGYKQSKLSFSKKSVSLKKINVECKNWNSIRLLISQKKGSDSESFDDDDDFENSLNASPPKRETTSRRAATKVMHTIHDLRLHWNTHTIKLNFSLLFSTEFL